VFFFSQLIQVFQQIGEFPADEQPRSTQMALFRAARPFLRAALGFCPRCPVASNTAPNADIAVLDPFRILIKANGMPDVTFL
jgi:hypothetical protein